MIIVAVALVLLGLAVGFVVAWAFGAGPSMNLVIGLLLVAAGAVVGFVVEWLIDEAYRKNRELRQLLHAQEDTAPGTGAEERGGDKAVETMADFLRRREEELHGLRGQLVDTQVHCEAIRDEFDDYRRAHPDDLTVIKGIGPVYQWKLRDAGVNTYKQLAAADPEKLERMLGVRGWQRTRIENWIDQARDWAQRSL